MKDLDLTFASDSNEAIGADALELADIGDAEAILANLASVFFQAESDVAGSDQIQEGPAPTLEARYRVLLDQIPAVVFMAYLDQGIGEAYVSPQIETTLG